MTRERLENAVGALIVGVIAAGLIYVSVIGNFNPALAKRKIWVHFADVNFLGRGSTVRMGGLIVGLVEELELVEDGVLVLASVDPAVRLHKGYTATVRSLSVLGGRYLELERGDARLAAVESARERPLRGAIEPGATEGFGEMMDRSTPLMEEAMRNIDEVIAKVDEAQGTLGKILNDPELENLISKASVNFELLSANLDRIARKVEDGSGTLGKILHEPRLRASIDHLVGAAGGISDRVSGGAGVVGAAASDEALGRALERMRTHLGSILDRLRAEDGPFRGERFERMRDDLARTMESLETIADRAREGRGPIAALLQDPEVEANLARAREHLDRFAARPASSTIARLTGDPTLARDLEVTFFDFGNSTADAREIPPVTPTLGGLIRARFDGSASDD